MRYVYFIFHFQLFQHQMRKVSVGFVGLIQPGTFVNLSNLCSQSQFLPVSSVFYSMCYLYSKQYRQRRMKYTTKFVCYLFIRYFLIHFQVIEQAFYQIFFVFLKFLYKNIKCTVFSLKLNNASSFLLCARETRC